MKEIIMKAASDMIQLYGLRKFTMDEIAAELKVSKKTIYKYFKSKDEIISEYFREIIESDKKSVLESVEKNVSLIEKLNLLIYSYHKYKLPSNILDEAYKFYHQEYERVQELRDFKLKQVELILNQAKVEGLIKDDIQLNMVSLILESASSTFLNYKFLSENDMSMRAAMKEIVNIILNGILKYNVN